MLKEFVQKIQDLAQAALRPQLLEVPGQAKDTATFALPSGELKTVTLASDPPSYKAASLKTLVALAQEANQHNDASIWYGRHAVIAILEQQYRRQRATYRLETTPQLDYLVSLEASSHWLDQKSMIRALRVNLAGCCHHSLLFAIRSVKWRTSDEGKTEVQHGKASLGRAIQSELTGSDSIPEEITLDVPLWKGLGATLYQIHCSFEIEPSTQRFCLQPFPGQIEAALLQAEVELGDTIVALLQGAEVPVYHGSP